MFATHGLPELIVTDNGMAFTSYEFQEFIAKNSVYQSHQNRPSWLGREGCMDIKGRAQKDDWGVSWNKTYSFSVSTSYSATTSQSPAELLLGRQPCPYLDQLQYCSIITSILHSSPRVVIIIIIISAIRKLLCIPITCWHGPSFFMAWNIHISCNH